MTGAPVLVAGVDSSTQSCKVVIVDAATGAIVRSGRASHPEGTEVPPAAWWDALWQDYKVVGRCFGLTDEDLPADIEDFDAYMDAMLGGDVLWVTDRAREVGRKVVLQPPVPLHLRPLRDLVNFITVCLLPPRLRRGYRLGWDPARSLALQGGGEYAKRLVVPLLPGRLRFIPSARAAKAA